jgi:hypothetical protein
MNNNKKIISLIPKKPAKTDDYFGAATPAQIEYNRPGRAIRKPSLQILFRKFLGLVPKSKSKGPVDSLVLGCGIGDEVDFIPKDELSRFVFSEPSSDCVKSFESSYPDLPILTSGIGDVRGKIPGLGIPDLCFPFRRLLLVNVMDQFSRAELPDMLGALYDLLQPSGVAYIIRDLNVSSRISQSIFDDNPTSIPFPWVSADLRPGVRFMNKQDYQAYLKAYKKMPDSIFAKYLANPRDGFKAAVARPGDYFRVLSNRLDKMGRGFEAENKAPLFKKTITFESYSQSLLSPAFLGAGFRVLGLPSIFNKAQRQLLKKFNINILIVQRPTKKK